MITFENVRKHIAMELGLSENTTWEQIEQARVNRDDLRLNYANKLGLSENPTWSEIDMAVEAELIRQDMIKELNLPSDYTLDQVNLFLAKKFKEEQIAELGLPADATWEQIDQAMYDQTNEKENNSNGMHR